MKDIVYLTIFAAVFFSCCSKNEEHPAPSACFLVDKTATTDPTHYFIFTNCSNNYSTSSWDFGDGHSSSDQSPSHHFNQIGQYTVKLTISNSDGVTSTNTRTIIIGHSTLTKIIYNHLNGTVNYPKHVFLSRYTSSYQMEYNNDASLSSASQLPFTVTLPDDIIYDNNYSFYYRFSENDFVGHTYTTLYFNISDLEIVNGRLDKTFNNSTDSAKVSLYFTIVPR